MCYGLRAVHTQLHCDSVFGHKMPNNSSRFISWLWLSASSSYFFSAFLVRNSIIFFARLRNYTHSRCSLAKQFRMPMATLNLFLLSRTLRYAQWPPLRASPHLATYSRTASDKLATRRHFCFCFSLWLLFRLFRELASARAHRVLSFRAMMMIKATHSRAFVQPLGSQQRIGVRQPTM